MSIINKDEVDKLMRNPFTKFAVRTAALAGGAYLIYENPKETLAILGVIAYELYVRNDSDKINKEKIMQAT